MAIAPIQEFLKKALEASAEPASFTWLAEQAEKIKASSSPSPFFLAFSRASRYFNKEGVSWVEPASGLLPEGVDPGAWDCLQVARMYLVLQLPAKQEAWLSIQQQMFETGDMYEQQALYAALPLFPNAGGLLPRAIEGCRTNMSVVFDAIALRNPYPSRFFPEANWNQLVLKAIFMQRPLYLIQGLDQRRNPSLAAMTRDFAHERWAAGRAVMPEVWRLLVPFMSSEYLDDLKKVLAAKDATEQKAGALAAYQSGYAPAQALLTSYPLLQEACANATYNWEDLGIEFQKNRV